MNQNRRVVRSLGLMGLTLLLLLLATTVVFAGRGDGNLSATPLQGTVESAPVAADKVQVAGDRAGARVDPDSLRPVSIIVTFDESVSDAELQAVSGGEVIHRYTKVFDGASLVLPEGNIEAVSKMSGVSGVYLDQLQQPDTDVSPQWIGAPTAWWQAGGVEVAGENVTVGILDTGIWPEHPSVADPDPAGNAYAPPPVVPGSNGFAGDPRDTCDFGNTGYNPNDAPFTCNNKLIGAYEFLDTYKAVQGLLPTEFDSARDDDGHGSHTMTTSAGNYGVLATLLGVNRGYVSGVAPRAHVIAYRVCAAEGCFNSDSVAAVEQAILDEVDVINYSISGGENPFSDAVELAFAAAYDNGVFVSASAGNDGPVPDTAAHRGPWTTTVAASTANRTYVSTVYLSADNGDTQELQGITITDGIATPLPVVFPPDGEEMCLEPFAPGTFNGEIVLCERGIIARVEKSYNAAAGGAAGVILWNPALQGLALDSHYIPTVHIEVDQSELLLDFMATHTGVMGWFTPGTAAPQQGDVIAAFSSRGGPGQSLGVSKPDITAPGVQILAGYTPMPAVPLGVDGQLFGLLNGTSMSSPHMAGSAAMIKDINPSWTPGQIKSAIMLTAVTSVVKEDGVTPATPFDTGSGRVDLTRAATSLLTMDESVYDYFMYSDALWQSNYPSFYHPALPGSVTVDRTFQNQSNVDLVFRTRVDAPADVQITVPSSFRVPRGGEQTIQLTVSAPNVPVGEVRHAMIYLAQPNGRNQMVFPVSFVRGESAISLEKTCDPAVFQIGSRSACSVTATNTSFEDVYVEMRDNIARYYAALVPSSVVGGENGAFGVWWNGWLPAAQAPLVNVAVDPLASPFGYFALSSLGIGPVAGMTDESIANFNVPAFEYAGELYTRIGVVSNGYAVVGGGTGADVDYVNTDLPNAASPNNVLAPFWTDLNPDAGGAIRVATLTDGIDTWLVIDWEGTPNWGSGAPNDFQIWIGLDGNTSGGEDISFTYGPRISDGDGFLTVGAENKFGNSGGTVYLDGSGTPPAPSYPAGDYEVDVYSVPGAPGGSHTISYEIRGEKLGSFTNCATMTSDWFDGTANACTDLQVVR